MARLNDYIKKMAGGDVEIPAPQNDLEKSLASIAEGGGGGGSDDVFYIHVTTNDEQTLIADKTYAEAFEALATKPVAMIGGGTIAYFNEYVTTADSAKMVFNRITIQNTTTPKMKVFSLALNDDDSVSVLGVYTYALTAEE